MELAAVREAYDIVADPYAEMCRDELAVQPVERGLLAAFAEQCAPGPVADLGCGPGYVTAHLRGLGLDAFGMDLSPGMVAVARRDFPGVHFQVGSLTALPLTDGALAGAVSLYSTMQLADDALAGAFAEMRRVLLPGAPALVAFLVGTGVVATDSWLGRSVTLELLLRSPERVADLLEAAGLPVRARLVRQPVGSETRPRAFLLAG